VNVVVATDGSGTSDRAVQYATDLAVATDGALAVVHVANPMIVENDDRPGDAVDRIVTEDPADADDRGERVLEDAVDTATEAGLSVDTELLHGNTVSALAEFVTDREVDTVVVGHRGLSERAEAAMGSVAKSLLERVDVPVTVVS
jgi:nucleotide-binding universal stress UspA family protein